MTKRSLSTRKFVEFWATSLTFGWMFDVCSDFFFSFWRFGKYVKIKNATQIQNIGIKLVKAVLNTRDSYQTHLSRYMLKSGNRVYWRSVFFFCVLVRLDWWWLWPRVLWTLSQCCTNVHLLTSTTRTTMAILPSWSQPRRVGSVRRRQYINSTSGLTVSVSFFCSGFITILNYILNFYSAVDTEIRDPRGFTALIKAGLQGREECVSALLMHGRTSPH